MSDRIEEIRTRVGGVGNWSIRPTHDGDEVDEHGVMCIEDNHGALVCHAWDENAELILNAPADIAWLLDEVERARGWARAWRVMAWRADHAWRASDGYDTRAGYPPEAEAHDELKRSRRKEWSERNREELAARADEWRRKHFEWIRDQQQRQRAMNEGGADA